MSKRSNWENEIWRQ